MGCRPISRRSTISASCDNARRSTISGSADPLLSADRLARRIACCTHRRRAGLPCPNPAIVADGFSAMVLTLSRGSPTGADCLWQQASRVGEGTSSCSGTKPAVFGDGDRLLKAQQAIADGIDGTWETPTAGTMAHSRPDQERGLVAQHDAQGDASSALGTWARSDLQTAV
jgi:hypothetical protein